MAEHIASSISTGGAGTVLEHRYSATCVALMLTQGELPFFPGSEIREVVVQAASFNWQTDDVVIKVTLPCGRHAVAAAQVKRTCSPIKSDDDFLDFITKAWTDFNNTEIFTNGLDRLILVSTFQSSGLYRFRQLIEQARANTNSASWTAKVAIPNYLSNEARKVKTAISALLQAQSPGISEAELWDFLRHCGVVLTDLDNEGGIHETQVVSLLRVTCGDPDPASGARNSWHELCSIVAVGEGVATTFRKSDLPELLQQRHGLSRHVDKEFLASLRRNSELALGGIRDTISGISLERTEIQSLIIENLNEHRMVLITGHAGSGKSAVAKHIFRNVACDSLALAYRVEEFAGVTLRASAAMHGMEFSKILELSASFSKRVVLIESIERLLEEERRDAFLDFLRQLASDASWHVIMTCRSSAADTVEQAFLHQVGMPYQRCEIPALTDLELSYFSDKLPALKRPLSDARLRELLRQPFLLEKAASLSWPESEALPAGEREFRYKVWAEAIRRNSVTTGGLPQRRADTFMTTALRRARQLSPFVHDADLDPSALERLASDNLIIRMADNESMIAPAHDVLEDWALLQWLDGVFHGNEKRLSPMLLSLELFPALRRSYRKWISEQIEAFPEELGPQIITVMQDSSLPQQWRDETISALLRSSHAGEFVRRNEAALLANQGKLLFRCIHLCRVAATTSSKFLPLALGRLSMARVPDGSGWVALGEILSNNLTLVSPARQLANVTDFASIWARSVSAVTPYPAGAATFARIALELLTLYRDVHGLDDLASALADVAIKVPLAAEDNLVEGVRTALSEGRFDRYRKGVHDFALDHFHNLPLCRDLPDLVIECLNAYLYPPCKNQHNRWRDRLEVEECFGLSANLRFERSEASAFCGPFLNLLACHPPKGLNLIISLLNQAAQTYADVTADGGDMIESPTQEEFELPDGSRKSIHSGWRLWAMYRGAGVSPNFLQSALMALEYWLLERAKDPNFDLENVLLRIVNESNNASFLALVASLSLAEPIRSGAAAYSVLTSPSFFTYDLARQVQEGVALENILVGLERNPERKILRTERASSRQLPHRRLTIEDLCRCLQQTKFRDRVWELLDRFKANAQAGFSGDVASAGWLNVLHRMDLRQYEAAGASDGKKYYVTKPLPQSVETVLAPARSTSDRDFQLQGLLMWGMKSFEHQHTNGEEDRWREMLSLALGQWPDGVSKDAFAVGAASYVATIAVRDHWSELSQPEKNWCSSVVAYEVLKESENFNDLAMGQIFKMSGDRPAAYIVSSLAENSPDNIELWKLLARALTHAVTEVRKYAFSGFFNIFNQSSPEKVFHVLSAFGDGTRLYAEMDQIEGVKDWQDRRDHLSLLQEALVHTKELICNPNPLGTNLIDHLRLDSKACFLFFEVAANWFARMHSSPHAKSFFSTNAQLLVSMWQRECENTDFESINALETALARYILSIPTNDAKLLARSLAEVITTESDKVGGFLWTLAVEADSSHKDASFWVIWEIFSEATLSLTDLDDSGLRVRHGILLEALFLIGRGTESIKDWHLVQGHEQQITELYAMLPASTTATCNYLVFLKQFGAVEIPRAYIPLANKITEKPVLLNRTNSFLLEELLSPGVFGTPAFLKRDPDVRTAVNTILDALINAGSAAAYVMRDDFATPLRQ